MPEGCPDDRLAGPPGRRDCAGRIHPALSVYSAVESALWLQFRRRNGGPLR
ncbi:hypothetical protein BZL30_0899 [Mycobacterium kansasii]|uniref:Uncharacterized protein n=1 Tax=Mycobacterium kansasii TaxID=1768 RepID=A0A1V3XRI0_MYCKA|nr:hypothetical protein BZL30_0899 [Mycobacterium kansasii]